MGVPMVRCLGNAGFNVRAWNRTSRCWPELPANVQVVARAEDALSGADAVILMLTDSEAVADILFTLGLARQLAAGSVVIDMSTSGPLAARDHAARLADLGVAYIDAPVSGGVKGAELGSLTILIGAPIGLIDRVRPILGAMGTPHHLGAVGAGQAAKLANQVIVAGYIAAVAEGLRFAELLGIDALQLVNALEGGFADSTILRKHGRRMAARDFSPGGTCRLHLKDLRLAADLAESESERFAVIREAIGRLRHLIDTGRGELDHSAYYLTYEDRR